MSAAKYEAAFPQFKCNGGFVRKSSVRPELDFALAANGGFDGPRRSDKYYR